MSIIKPSFTARIARAAFFKTIRAVRGAGTLYQKALDEVVEEHRQQVVAAGQQVYDLTAAFAEAHKQASQQEAAAKDTYNAVRTAAQQESDWIKHYTEVGQ